MLCPITFHQTCSLVHSRCSRKCICFWLDSSGTRCRLLNKPRPCRLQDSIHCQQLTPMCTVTFTLNTRILLTYLYLWQGNTMCTVTGQYTLSTANLNVHITSTLNTRILLMARKHRLSPQLELAETEHILNQRTHKFKKEQWQVNTIYHSNPREIILKRKKLRISKTYVIRNSIVKIFSSVPVV